MFIRLGKMDIKWSVLSDPNFIGEKNVNDRYFTDGYCWVEL